MCRLVVTRRTGGRHFQEGRHVVAEAHHAVAVVTLFAARTIAVTFAGGTGFRSGGAGALLTLAARTLCAFGAIGPFGAGRAVGTIRTGRTVVAVCARLTLGAGFAFRTGFTFRTRFTFRASLALGARLAYGTRFTLSAGFHRLRHGLGGA